MNKLDMLSAKNVKIHGMESRRWITKDKITQYKGLINLYSRDRKILEFDTHIAGRRQNKELKKLRLDIENNRLELDNAIRGDKQQLRNTLSEYRNMQLAYQNSLPKTVIENIHQINFNKRKELDKLANKMELISQKLIDLKLNRALLEDRLKYGPDHVPMEKQAEIITGKVQDALLKKEAALSIKHVYDQMINVMRKDALYFDVILTTIRTDGLNQSKCMMNATKLGQLATEYFDDRRQEYKTLEEMVKRDMKSRKIDLDEVQEQVENASSNIKQLLRRDSDINIGKLEIKDTESVLELETELKEIEKTLLFLQNSTMVTSYELIQPCLEAQLIQEERLQQMVEKSVQSRNTLINKTNHAELMKNLFENTMIETTLEYKLQKQEIIELINSEILRMNDSRVLIKTRNDLTAKIRISFKQLQQICKLIGKDPSEHKRKTKILTEKESDDEIPHEPNAEENDGCKMILEITTKLRLLANNVHRPFDMSLEHDAYKFYEIMIKSRCIMKEFKQEIDEDSLLEGLELEVSHVPTRDDIKRQSQQIVDLNSKNDDLVPLFTPKRKKLKF